MPSTAVVSVATLDQVRQFNRFYTQQIGVLDEGILASPFSLTEVRVLYELEHQSPTTAAHLCEQLRLDPGYLSRILGRFQKQGLIRRVRSAKDARQTEITMTAKGHRTLRPLEERSRDQMNALLSGLSATHLQTLTQAMATITALLDPGGQATSSGKAALTRTASTAATATPANTQTPTLILRAAHIGDIGWVIHRQSLLYAKEYGWNQEFEALLAEIGAQFIRRFKPAHERAWVAEYQGHVVGSVFLVQKSRYVAQLRLLYVESNARGLGIGARLVDECLASARALGYRKVILWTNSILDSARRIYEARGFVLVSEEHHHSFGKALTGQFWELSFSER